MTICLRGEGRPDTGCDSDALVFFRLTKAIKVVKATEASARAL